MTQNVKIRIEHFDDVYPDFFEEFMVDSIKNENDEVIHIFEIEMNTSYNRDYFSEYNLDMIINEFHEMDFEIYYQILIDGEKTREGNSYKSIHDYFVEYIKLEIIKSFSSEIPEETEIELTDVNGDYEYICFTITYNEYMPTVTFTPHEECVSINEVELNNGVLTLYCKMQMDTLRISELY
jgi:hypothetical protein